MNQPKVFYEGRIYDVASIWWTDGKIDFLSIYFEGAVKTLFSSYGNFHFVKEEEANA